MMCFLILSLSIFKIYTNNGVEADRLIIQAESLLRLITSKTQLKKYDLVVIDEVESILRQVMSHTFRGKAPKTYDLWCVYVW